MPSAGWYPDPDRTPGRYRYWDGERWTDRTSAEPPPGADRNSRVGVIIGVLILVVVVAVVSTLVIRARTSGVGEDTNPRQATATGWDDSSPLPTATPTPSVRPVPTAHPAACEQYDTSAAPAEPADGRVHGGPLSFTRLGNGWSAPTALNRFPYSRDAYVQTLDLPEKLPWQASVEVGVNTMKPFPGADQATAQLLQCLVSSDFYANLQVRVTENSSKSIMVGSTRAVQRDALLRFRDPDLTTTGSRIRIIVVDSSPVSFYFHAVPMERRDLIAELDQATASLRVD
ncbi:MAG: DUF2510 domain-containing protein [Microlunatus sp.]|nr:DUF2510 domain-containing protein [Microlunatus sp.]